jgi:hypothetical protein
MEDARTLSRSLGTGAHVFTFESSFVRTEAAEDGVRDVVPAVSAAGIPAREEKQRGRVFDHDASHVDRFGDHTPPASFLDL